MARHFLHALVLAGFLGSAVASYSQNPDDNVFAGRSLGDLQASLHAGSPLQTKMLQKEIEEDLLDALLVPAAQGNPATPVVERTRRTFTKLEKLPITVQDLKTLQDFAADGIYLSAKGLRTALLTGRTADIQASRTEIDKTIAQLPAAKQDYAKRFVGALISEVAPKEKYVDDYRSFVEQRTARALADDPNTLSAGKPYAFGAGKLTLHNLKTVKQDQVREFTIGDKTYLKAWMGSTLVVVPQKMESPAKGPTGLDSLHLNNDLKVLIIQERPGGNQWIQKMRGDG